MDNIVTDLGRRRLAIGFLGLAAALVIPGARPLRASEFPAPYGHISRRFNVFWDKDAIGTHHVEVMPGLRSRSWRVEVEIGLEVDLGLFGTVDYHYTSWEWWLDGRLAALESRTDDDGDVSEVAGHASGRHFRLEGPNGLVDAPGDLLTSNSAWSEAICRQNKIIDTTTGTVVDFTALPEGSRTTTTASGLETARAYQVTCPIIAGSFWYDTAGLWMRGRLIRKGEKIDYFLDT
jgi:hypothetical protein